MMDPDYRTFLRYHYPEYDGIDPALLGQIEGADYVHALRNYFEEAGMDLSLLGPIEGEEEEEEEEDEEYNDDGGAVDGPSGTTSGQVVSDRVRDLPQEIVDVDGLASVDADVTVEGERESSSQRRDINGGKEGEAASSKVGSDGESGESGSGEVDGLFCPICYEAWSSGGDHRIWYVLYFVLTFPVWKFGELYCSIALMVNRACYPVYICWILVVCHVGIYTDYLVSRNGWVVKARARYF